MRVSEGFHDLHVLLFFQFLYYLLYYRFKGFQFCYYTIYNILLINLNINDLRQKQGYSTNPNQEDPRYIVKALSNVLYSPYYRLNITFASRKVFTDFMLTSFLIIVVPILFVAIANGYVKDDPEMSELMKVGIVVGPVLVYMNIVMGIYIYRAIKDP